MRNIWNSWISFVIHTSEKETWHDRFHTSIHVHKGCKNRKWQKIQPCKRMSKVCENKAIPTCTKFSWVYWLIGIPNIDNDGKIKIIFERCLLLRELFLPITQLSWEAAVRRWCSDELSLNNTYIPDYSYWDHQSPGFGCPAHAKSPLCPDPVPQPGGG